MEITAGMMNRADRVVKWPDPVLRAICNEVNPSANVLRLVEKMRSLIVHNGLGLAAPQVGVPARIFIWNIDNESGAVVNPSLEDPVGKVAMPEGCLSLPDVCITVNRAESVTLVGLTATGEPLRLRNGGMLARVWQHELDHLDGLTLAERMTTAEGITNRHVLKRLKVGLRKAKR